MFDELVVAIDICELAQLKRSLAVARKNLATDGRITLLHVMSPLPGFIASQIDQKDRVLAWQSSQAVLDKIIASESLPANTVGRLEVGSVYRKLIEVAGNNEGTAIIIASHTPGASDVLMGSVAAQVIKHAKCSVLVVRDRQLPLNVGS